MVGTADYLADAEKQNYASPDPGASSPEWDTIYGELFSFDDPEERLPALDDLEGFRPGEKGLYRRVLIPVTLPETDTAALAWTYVVEPAYGVYLPGGRWPAQ